MTTGNYYPFITKCPSCKKEFLLEIVQDKPFNNVIGISVMCKECLAKKGVTPEFEQSNPKEAKIFKDWLEHEKEFEPDDIVDLRGVKPSKKKKR